MNITNQYDENGKKTGLWIERNEDGQILNSINYKAGKLNGKYTEFNPITGLITSSSEYREGLLHGTYKSYDDKGNLRKSIEYKNNLKNGVALSYFSNGIIESKANFKEGLLHGKCEHFYDNGQLKEVGYYRNRDPHGIFIGLYKNGELDYITSFKEGKINRLFLQFDENGILKNSKLNKNGNEDFSSSNKEKEELVPRESQKLFKELEKDDYLKTIIKNTSWGKSQGNTTEQDWGNKILQDKISSLENER